MGTTHPVLSWNLQEGQYDVVLVYKRRLTPDGPITQHTFACRAMDYTGDRTAAVEADKERKLLILTTYGDLFEGEPWPDRPVTGRLLVPVEDIVEIVAQERHEHYDKPDEIGELLCWPESTGLLIRTALQSGLVRR